MAFDSVLGLASQELVDPPAAKPQRSCRTMGTERIYQTVLGLATTHAEQIPVRTHLDIGPGTGRLIALFREQWDIQSAACDYTDALMKLPGQRVDIADLNKERLPYGEDSFDLVTAIEVVEHLEHYREVLRDIYRVLKPGGLCILTTPNVLNLNSRLRFLWFGFWNLFGPLPIGNTALQSTAGHITPVPCFYVAHALADAGFAAISITVDKYQRSAIPKLILLYLPLRAFGALAYRKEVSRFATINARNAPFVRAMNSLPMLLGRTLVVSAIKPAR